MKPFWTFQRSGGALRSRCTEYPNCRISPFIVRDVVSAVLTLWPARVPCRWRPLRKLSP